MDYEKMWNTLKAQSGYRNTNCPVMARCGFDSNIPLRDIMLAIEEMALDQATDPNRNVSV